MVALHGVVQVDSRTFQQNDKVPGNDSILLRRARPILSGTVFRDFDFLFVPEFGGGTPGASSSATTPSIYDAYVNYHYSPAFQIQAGKFKAPVGLEQLQADVNTSLNERSLVTDLVPNRDLGFELHGDIAGGVLSYAAGIFNGVGDARNSSNIGFQDDREFDGRLFVQPFKATRLQAAAKSRLWRRRQLGGFVHHQHPRSAQHDGRVAAGILHGRPAAVLRLHQRRGGQPHTLAAVTAGLLLLWPAEFDG